MQNTNKNDSTDFEWAIPLEIFLPVIISLIWGCTVLVCLL